jgi:hypothetical protein
MPPPSQWTLQEVIFTLEGFSAIEKRKEFKKWPEKMKQHHFEAKQRMKNRLAFYNAGKVNKVVLPSDPSPET